jgi:hypothetical protein
MIHVRWLLLLFCVSTVPLIGGCTTSTSAGDDAVFVVHGVGGAGASGGLVNALKRPGRSVRSFEWGAPAPLFFLNFSGKSTHEQAEQKLAAAVGKWHSEHPGGRIELVGHSAGCGVILGALPRLDFDVGTVILLAPSVSPQYDLHAALAKINGTLHVFHSERDTTFLKWRTGNFGTYDRVKTPAAGNLGFEGAYPANKLIQHPYDPAWEKLGNDGGHFGPVQKGFVRAVVEPLLE